MQTNNLKSIREKLQLSQRELAELVGVTQGNISHIECNRQLVSVDIARSVIHLAKFQGIDLTFDDIYGKLGADETAQAQQPEAA